MRFLYQENEKKIKISWDSVIRRRSGFELLDPIDPLV